MQSGHQRKCLWVAAMLVAVLAAILPRPAQAWPEAPLCALREPQLETDAPFSLATADDIDAPAEGPGNAFLDPGPLAAAAAREIPWTAPVTTADARRAFAEATASEQRGQLDDALLQLRVAAHGMPVVEDRLALRQGQLLMAMDQADAACRAFEQAADSPHRSVAASARVGRVHCALERDEAGAERHLQRLLARYPLVSNLGELKLAQARYRERRDNRRGAANIYRQLDLQLPGSRQARLAREALGQLAAEGVRVRPLTPTERVDRAEALVQQGPVDLARMALAELLGDEHLPASSRARVYVLAAKMARTEGRWEDAREAAMRAAKLGAGAEAQRYLPPPAPADDAAEQERAQRQARMKLKQIQRRRSLMRLPDMQLRTMVRIAVESRLREEASELMAVIAKRRSLRAATRYETALEAVGLVEDRLIAEALEPVVDVYRYRLAGRYHYARALERLGETAAAVEAYERIDELDQTSTRYYAMWAQQRLSAIALRESDTQGCQRGPDGEPVTAACGGDEGLLREPLQEATLRLSPSDRRQVIETLMPIADQHAMSYPWFGRAISLLRLGDIKAATDELNEAYLAYRDAMGSLRFRSGLEAVYTGEAPPRRGADWPTLRARRLLTSDQREVLARVSRKLGDPGTALRFGHWDPDDRPRAYPAAVMRAAEEHGVDPNLLYAVMRVESIYNPRIISHVGAVGLMQIMPRTGRLIASSMGKVDFEVSDLLQPETNVRFAAWYLASLIERFEGRLPLAIAAYNGGPHNVRLWLRKRPADMPLDAFLEHIPFSQTHRYVRRVLTHYAAYRTQQKLPMPQLATRLPQPGPDAMAF